MKNLFSLLLLVFIISKSFTQTELDFYTNPDYTNFHNNIEKSHISLNAHTIDDVIWSLDSTLTFNLKDKLSQRYYVTAKNEYGNMISAHKFHLYLIGNTPQWVKEDTMTEKYHNNGKRQEYLLRKWDLRTNVLADTSIFYKLNKEGKLLEEIDAASYSNGKSKKKYTYNNKGLIVKYISQKYEYEFDDDWVNEERELTTYDTNGNIIEEVKQEWADWLNKWINKRKSINTYDNNNNLLKNESQKWDIDLEKWENYHRYVYEYDNNFKIEFSNEYWNSNEEKWDVRYHGYYTNDGINIRKIFIEKWNENNNEFENSFQKNYTYDNNNNQIEYFSQKWDKGLGVWINYKKEINEYDNFNNDILYQRQTWDKNKEKWINTRKTSRTYNANNSLTLFLTQEWSNTSEEWINKLRDVYIFNNNNLLINEDNQKWNNSKKEWEYRHRKKHFWSEFKPSNTLKSERKKIIISPNPCLNKIEISCDRNQIIKKIQIFSISGKLIKFQMNNLNQAIDLSDLQNGLYYINIETNNGYYIKKFIKN